MGRAVLEAHPEIAEIKLSAPNMHHFVYDLSPFGLENPNEVFHADDRPYGLIQATVQRDDATPDDADAGPGLVHRAGVRMSSQRERDGPADRDATALAGPGRRPRRAQRRRGRRPVRRADRASTTSWSAPASTGSPATWTRPRTPR